MRGLGKSSTAPKGYGEPSEKIKSGRPSLARNGDADGRAPADILEEHLPAQHLYPPHQRPRRHRPARPQPRHVGDAVVADLEGDAVAVRLQREIHHGRSEEHTSELQSL